MSATGNARDGKSAECSKEAPATPDEHREGPFLVPGLREERQVITEATTYPVEEVYGHPAVYPA
jgi:hypothetical protein